MYYSQSNDVREMLSYFYEHEGLCPLTPAEQAIFDPMGIESSKHRNRIRQEDFHPNPIRPGMEAVPLDSILALARSFYDDVPEIQGYHDDMCAKIGPQGGVIPWSSIRGSIEEMFSPTGHIVIHDDIYVARDFLLRLIRDAIHQYGPVQLCDATPPPNTSFGPPYFGQKNSPLQYYEQLTTVVLERLWPAAIATRYQRLKPRVVYMDSGYNVYKMTPMFATVRRFLTRALPFLFMAWQNPYQTTYVYATQAIDECSTFVGLDYTHMDVHVRFKLVAEIVLPIYEAILPKSWYLLVANYMEMVFRQPLLLGNSMLCGEHGIFSGVIMTNDIETILSVIVGLALIYNDLNNGKIFALGDDLSIAVKTGQGDVIRNRFCDYANEAGMIANLEKTSTSDQVLSFLRRMFIRGKCKRVLASDYGGVNRYVQQGVYPVPLTLNSIFHPEYCNTTWERHLGSVLQILDVLVGHRAYSQVADFVFAHMDYGSRLPEVEDGWWEKLTGVSWSATSSQSYRRYLSMKTTRSNGK